MSYVAESEAYMGCTIKIVLDESPSNPRTEWDNFGFLVLKEGGDNTGIDKGETLNDLVRNVEREIGPMFFMKVRRYEHSGVGFRAYMPTESPMGYPWDCPWDSGWAGIIAVSKKKVRDEFSKKRISGKVLEKVYANLRIEVETYSCWANGECYGYVCEDPDGNDIEDGSCWGYFGNDMDYMKDEARSAIDHHVATKKARLEELRIELDEERISYGELAELQALKAYIDPSDVQLLEAAGVPEFPEEVEA